MDDCDVDIDLTTTSGGEIKLVPKRFVQDFPLIGMRGYSRRIAQQSGSSMWTRPHSRRNNFPSCV